MIHRRTAELHAVWNVRRRERFSRRAAKDACLEQVRTPRVRGPKVGLTGYSAMARCSTMGLLSWGGVRYCARSIADGDTAEMIDVWRSTANLWAELPHAEQ
jgi:hypothetical protein